MKTFPKVDPSGQILSFEIENVYVSAATCARILDSVEGVSAVQKRRPFSAWDEVHVRFRFRGSDCVVWEPHGDNSRYWIGQPDGAHVLDMSVVEQAFRNYVPPFHRRVIGDIVTLHFVKKLLGRDEEWHRVSPPPP